MTTEAYSLALQKALDELEDAVCQAEAAGLMVVCRQHEMPIEGSESVIMNSFEVYQRLL